MTEAKTGSIVDLLNERLEYLRKREEGQQRKQAERQARAAQQAEQITQRLRPTYKQTKIHRWDRKQVREAIRLWVELYGEIPSVADWNINALRGWGADEKIKRYLDPEHDWPSHGTVRNVYGSHNKAIRAAGFTPRTPTRQLHRRKARA